MLLDILDHCWPILYADIECMRESDEITQDYSKEWAPLGLFSSRTRPRYLSVQYGISKASFYFDSPLSAATRTFFSSNIFANSPF